MCIIKLKSKSLKRIQMMPGKNDKSNQNKSQVIAENLNQSS